MNMTESFMLTPRPELNGKSPLQVMIDMAKEDVRRHGKAWGFGSQGALPKMNEEAQESGSKSKGGRPTRPEVEIRRAAITDLHAKGYTARQIAEQVGASRKTVWSDIAIAEGRGPEHRRRRDPS